MAWWLTGGKPLSEPIRTPLFWGYPPPAQYYPILLIHIGSQVKTRQSQSYKFEEFAKISNLLILKQNKTNTLHTTYLLKLLDKMCKYEMDLASIVEDTEQTWFCRQTDKVKPIYPPSTFKIKMFSDTYVALGGDELSLFISCFSILATGINLRALRFKSS